MINRNTTPAPSEEEALRQREYIDKLKIYFSDRSKALNRPITYHITTFGCQMNARDSEKLAGVLDEIGLMCVEDEEADLCFFNTCSIRENASTKLYGHIGRVGAMKKKNPDMIIGICGCMMQEADEVEKIKNERKFVDIVFGTHNIFKFAELIYNRITSGSMIIDIWKDTDMIVENLPNTRKYPFKSGVNITYGCDNFCTFCIVPYVRGRERSRRAIDIVREVENFVRDGVVEVMLLGQNVNSYGKGLDEPCTFAELLEAVAHVKGLKRVRFMTPNPKDMGDDVIEVIKNNPNICRHIHLPLQSGSTSLLRRMNRHYSKEQFLSLVYRIREAIPDVSLTTDIIVGFPGETDEDFEDTIDVVRKSGFDSAFTFIYSPRVGTPAARFEDKIPDEITKERFDRLLKCVGEEAAKRSGRDVGKTLPVLVEDVEDRVEEDGKTLVTGRLSNNILVHFTGDESLIGKIVDVTLTESKGFYYMGRMAD